MFFKQKVKKYKAYLWSGIKNQKKFNFDGLSTEYKPAKTPTAGAGRRSTRIIGRFFPPGARKTAIEMFAAKRETHITKEAFKSKFYEQMRDLGIDYEEFKLLERLTSRPDMVYAVISKQ